MLRARSGEMEHRASGGEWDAGVLVRVVEQKESPKAPLPHLPLRARVRAEHVRGGGGTVEGARLYGSQKPPSHNLLEQCRMICLRFT